MNCIMIDDSIKKYYAIQEALSPVDNIDYHLNLTTGLEALSDNLKSQKTSTPQSPFDLLILDMNFPIRTKSTTC